MSELQGQRLINNLQYISLCFWDNIVFKELCITMFYIIIIMR